MNKIKSLVGCDSKGKFYFRFTTTEGDSFFLFKYGGDIEFDKRWGVYVENSMCLYLGII